MGGGREDYIIKFKIQHQNDNNDNKDLIQRAIPKRREKERRKGESLTVSLHAKLGRVS